MLKLMMFLFQPIPDGTIVQVTQCASAELQGQSVEKSSCGLNFWSFAQIRKFKLFQIIHW